MTEDHTPGPWLMEGNKIGVLVGPKNSPTYYAPICTLDDGWETITGDANARLIAAAPEMLSALSVAYEQLAAWIDNECWDGDDDAALATIFAALAKAKET